MTSIKLNTGGESHEAALRKHCSCGRKDTSGIGREAATVERRIYSVRLAGRRDTPERRGLSINALAAWRQPRCLRLLERAGPWRQVIPKDTQIMAGEGPAQCFSIVQAACVKRRRCKFRTYTACHCGGRISGSAEECGMASDVGRPIKARINEYATRRSETEGSTPSLHDCFSTTTPRQGDGRCQLHALIANRRASSMLTSCPNLFSINWIATTHMRCFTGSRKMINTMLPFVIVAAMVEIASGIGTVGVGNITTKTIHEATTAHTPTTAACVNVTESTPRRRTPNSINSPICVCLGSLSGGTS